MQSSIVVSAFVAAIVGFGASLAIVLSGAAAVGADPMQTASWVTGLCLAMAATATYLSYRHKMPIVTAWSTPGAALLAASGAIADIHSAVGAFLCVAVLILLTAAFRPFARLVERIPTSVAAAMLAGVLLQFVVAVVEHAAVSPWLVLPLLGLFFLLRLWSPSWAVLAVLAGGVPLAFALDMVASMDGVVRLTTLTLVTPDFDASVILGLGLPLYLVTMASQNIPGFAVLKSSGYEPPTRSILGVTGLASLLTAPLGSHTSNLSSITAAICTGPDVHPDPAKRWMTGPFYGLFYVLFGIAGASLVALFDALPAALIATVAGLALAPPLAQSMAAALKADTDRIAAVATFVVTASGTSFLGISSAFWGLLVGLLIVGLDRLKMRGNAAP